MSIKNILKLQTVAQKIPQANLGLLLEGLPVTTVLSILLYAILQH